MATDEIVIDAGSLTLEQGISYVNALIQAVEMSAKDYMESSSYTNLYNSISDGNGTNISFSIPINLKILGVVAAITQTPLAFTGSSDAGKTALAERILNGLFGSYGRDWWRMEINRGITIDDLIDIDTEKLSRAKLSEAVSGAKWLNKPARLLDEINRAHAKLLNLVLHLADGSGFNVRGDLFLPVGQPYQINGEEKRYSFTISTANPTDQNYSGTYEADSACTRRLVISVDFDELAYNPEDAAKLEAGGRRAKTFLLHLKSYTRQIIEVYESLPTMIPFSGLARLFLCFLSGRNICVQSRSGRIQPHLVPKICENCHLGKSHSYCGKIGGLTKGLFLSTKELARALAAVRAAIVLNQVRQQCVEAKDAPLMAKLKKLLATNAGEDKLYERFQKYYFGKLCVTVEDVQTAYFLVAPNHIWFEAEWLGKQPEFEGKEVYLFRKVGREELETMLTLFKKHHDLVKRIAFSPEVSTTDQNEIERISKAEDPAFLALVAALRNGDLPPQFAKELPKEYETDR